MKSISICRALNCFKNFLIFISAFSVFVSISDSVLFIGVSAGITNSAVGLKICALISGIKEYKSIIMKKRKKQDKIVSIAKITLNAIKVLISKALNYSCIIHDKFVSINIVLR